MTFLFGPDNRGFMTQNGQPDNPRAARYLLKDYVNGKLLYCVAPSTIEQEKFHIFPPQRRMVSINKHLPARAIRANKGSKVTSEDVDKVFFRSNHSNVHVKGVIGKMQGISRAGSKYVTLLYIYYFVKSFLYNY